jgi:hypothetical protein
MAESATNLVRCSLIAIMVFAHFMPPIAGIVMALARPLGVLVAPVPALAVINRHAGDLGTIARSRRRPIAGLSQRREAEKNRERAENESLSHCLFSAVLRRPGIRPRRRRRCAPGDDGRLLIHVSNMSGRFGHAGAD